MAELNAMPDSDPARPRDAFTVLTWNVLAAPWAAPEFYPATLDPARLDRGRRAALVASFLVDHDADVMCLQETTPTDLAVALEALGAGFEHHAAPNGETLWSSWTRPETPWEPNGTAVIWRRDLLGDVQAAAFTLSDDGNASTRLSGRLPSGRAIRVTSVHLDADDPTIRRRQLPVLLGADRPDPEVLDVVAGDCNEDTTGDIGAMVSEHGYVDALSVLGRLEPTHPYACPTDDYAPIARLDHILLRHGTAVAGEVVDSGVWPVPTPEARLAAHLERVGSDHLPVVATVAF